MLIGTLNNLKKTLHNNKNKHKTWHKIQAIKFISTFAFADGN